MSRDDLVDLLRSLSIIEGAVCSAPKDVEQRVLDELDWAVNKIMEELKEVHHVCPESV